METWCFLGILFSLPHNKADVYVCAALRPKEEVLFNVFEPKLVDSLLYAMIYFFNHGIQGTATWSQLSFVPLMTLGTGEMEIKTRYEVHIYIM